MKPDAIGCDVHEKRFSRVWTARLQPPSKNTLSTAVLLSISRYRRLILAVRNDGSLGKPETCVWNPDPAIHACQSPPLLEHCVGVVGDGRDGLQHIPVLDDLAINIEAENVNASDFLAKQIQVPFFGEYS
jgi:hypothetical protein